MSSIRGKNTHPEITIRRILWSVGKRYRIHDTTVFGKPDISNKKKVVAIFIDGCFWHGCKKCYEEPKTNTDFWRKKILSNKHRREEVVRHLKQDGWTMLQFWEHEIRQNPYAVVERILKVL